ncbi:MAG: 50S ribosomal protein L25 [Proteobacteria bacterium]|nr:50S ribosomal protein L25 [Pseudomonadota bacterium]MBU1611709.1 50S ribosomal protein L25 [Pseudomonadota bacterium]
MAKKTIETLTVTERTATGKGPNRRLRVQEIIPGVYYDQHGANRLFQVAYLPFSKLYKKVGTTQVFNLSIGGGDPLPSLVWRIKNDPVRTMPKHLDFFGVDLDKELSVFVHFSLVGDSVGVKLGGILNLFREGLELTCKPLDIPEHIEIDITDLDINQSISIADLELPEGVKFDYDENFALVSISERTTEEDEETEEMDAEVEEEETEAEE